MLQRYFYNNDNKFKLHSLVGLYALSMNELDVARRHFETALEDPAQSNRVLNLLSIILISIRQRKNENFDLNVDQLRNLPLKAAYHISCGLSCLAKKQLDEAK